MSISACFNRLRVVCSHFPLVGGLGVTHSLRGGLGQLQQRSVCGTSTPTPVRRLQQPYGLTVCRCYGLSRAAASVKQWEATRAERGVDEGDFDDLCKSMTANLERCRFTKRSNLSKLYDLVSTAEELERAEKVLETFRHGLNLPRLSLPLPLVRACIRVGKPAKALEYVTNKVKYGVFPSRRVYRILMNSLLSNKDAKGATAAYRQLLTDEIVPDAFTYYLAAVAQAMKGSPEGVEKALELGGRCRELNSKLGTEAYREIIKGLVEEGQSEKAVEVVEKLERAGLLPQQSLLNLRLHALTGAGHLAEGVTLLEREVCGRETGELGVPREAFPQLVEAVGDRGDAGTQEALKALTQKLESRGKLPLATEPTSHSHRQLPD